MTTDSKKSFEAALAAGKTAPEPRPPFVPRPIIFLDSHNGLREYFAGEKYDYTRREGNFLFYYHQAICIATSKGLALDTQYCLVTWDYNGETK